MTYLQVSFICIPNEDIVTDVLASDLSQIGFESFVPTQDGIDAFIPESMFSEENIKAVIDNFYIEANIEFSIKEIADKNWNEEWEKYYFKPIVIDNRCIIHSSFQEAGGDFEYNILIDPKMAFGTGHHQTTGLIISEVLQLDFNDKSVLDMGCGTAVLAILAKMRGAGRVVAIDIDEWAYRNALDNIKLNNTADIEVRLGGVNVLEVEDFDIILANINRNILLQDMSVYANHLRNGGRLVMSGFYKEDIPVIQNEATKQGLQYSHFKELDNWVTVTCFK